MSNQQRRHPVVASDFFYLFRSRFKIYINSHDLECREYRLHPGQRFCVCAESVSGPFLAPSQNQNQKTDRLIRLLLEGLSASTGYFQG